jgi:hypothetical protein
MNKSVFFALFIISLMISIYAFSQSTNHPQKFNLNPNLEKLGINPSKIKGIDSLMQSFVDEKKLNCVVGFVAQGGNVIYHKAFGL